MAYVICILIQQKGLILSINVRTLSQYFTSLRNDILLHDLGFVSLVSAVVVLGGAFLPGQSAIVCNIVGLVPFHLQRVSHFL